MAQYDDMENATVGRKPDDDGDKKKKKKKSDPYADLDGDKSKSGEDKGDDDDAADEATDGSESGDDLDEGSGDGQDDESDKQKNGPKDVAKKVDAAVSGAQAVHKAMMMAKFIEWLKMMLQMMQQLITAAIQAVVSLVQTIVTAVVNVATTIGAALGISAVATLFGGIAAIVVAAVVVVTVVVSTVQSNEVAKLDTPVVDCAEDVRRAEGDLATGDTSAITLEMAQKVYSFYFTYGADDIHIAGILGNWSEESGIDPTGLEGIYSEPFSVTGERKSSAISDLNNYTVNVLFPLYASENISINRDAFKASDGKYYCGLGLGQWTGPRALGLLQTAASSQLEWYTIDAQLVYSVSTDSRASMLNTWFETEEASPEDAAATFMHTWEGIDTDNVDDRQSAAAGWYYQMAEWAVDADYADSLIELANVARLDASADGVRDQLDNCLSQQNYDNSSIAAAAVSYAYRTAVEGEDDNGTQLYQTVHDAIFPGDPYYASCDRGAATAIRWSGSDDTFPKGDCSTQFDYCWGSTKWERIIWGGDVDSLQPGDVLICDDCHTFLYTGNEIIKQIHGEDMAENAIAVEAGYGRTAPVCIPMFSNYLTDHTFEAFRCIAPDNSTTYANAADGYESHVNVPFDESQYP